MFYGLVQLIMHVVLQLILVLCGLCFSNAVSHSIIMSI
ncbi:hypothetical protein OIU79_014190 [Salix purpurea]|uniref:Uncharacterized protein n=1 Tax=Salix purpurea TaxID=77065 RepID=A0A9Q0PQN2_SALPP|nr:hypothetical protein OIU79_014190 [Salix purpurea]